MFASGTAVKSTLVREEQWANAPRPMVTRDAGNVREVREEQPAKARSPMLVSVAGSVSSVSEVHSSKAFVPMVTRDAGSECEGRGVRAECTQKRRNRRCW